MTDFRAGGAPDFRDAGSTDLRAGGATDLRAAGGTLRREAGGGATDLRAVLAFADDLGFFLGMDRRLPTPQPGRIGANPRSVLYLREFSEFR
jgi:hypothetical protein